jgi:hypothetical protein
VVVIAAIPTILPPPRTVVVLRPPTIIPVTIAAHDIAIVGVVVAATIRHPVAPVITRLLVVAIVHAPIHSIAPPVVSVVGVAVMPAPHHPIATAAPFSII